MKNVLTSKKQIFAIKYLVNPFFISIEEVATISFNHQPQLNQIINSLDNEKEENEEDSEYSEDEEIEEEIKQINTKQTFKSVECVICLINPPNVLFCNCGHLCLCEECNKVKSLKDCPICKTENTIKRTIEY